MGVDIDAVRKKINIEQMGDKPVESERDELTRLCEAFLKIQVPRQNIISQEKFAKYERLFNAEEMNKLSTKDQKDLYYQYWCDFSLQHPIKVYGKVVDEPEESKEEVIFSEEDQKYHQVVYTVPPVFRQTHTLNELGSKVPSLINALYNTHTKSDNPIARAEFERYGIQIANAIMMVNPESQQKADEAKAVAMDEALLRKKGGHEETAEEPSKNSQDDADGMTDMFEW